MPGQGKGSTSVIRWTLGIAFGVAAGSPASFAQVDPPELVVRRSNVTGLATFVTAKDRGVILRAGAAAAAPQQPADVLRAYGRLFGVTDPANQLIQDAATADAIGFTRTKFRQVNRGVPVFSGVLNVHQDAAGGVTAINGDFYPVPAKLNTIPQMSSDAAAAMAAARLDRWKPLVERSELVIVDPGWYGDPPAGVHLAYYLILSDPAAGLRQAFFIDAHNGRVLDQWNLRHTALVRQVFDDVLGMVVRAEGSLPVGDFDADGAYDYSGDLYGLLFRSFGRDSIDSFGLQLSSTVHLQDPACPNAFGGPFGTAYCTGVVTDDIVAHEFGHGLTVWTADLIYQNQSGQLNESYSDVWGEAVDLLNGDAAFAGPPGGTPWPAHPSGPGTDTPNDLRTPACVAGAVMQVNAPLNIAGEYAAQPAFFGPVLTAGGVTRDLVLANPPLACNADGPFTNAAAMVNKIVLVDRGSCTFVEKVLKAQNAGAAAVIVANNVAFGMSPMGGTDPAVTIPSVGISQADGNVLKVSLLSAIVNVTLRRNTTPKVRWLVGEDSSGFGGAIRDMWNPVCMGDPDRANHPLQICDPNDGGGVHSGSGVPNHAFAILVDGKTFNGFTVSAIGMFKTTAVWYRALTAYLTPASDFRDAYFALNQAATDLVGTIVKDPRDGSDFAVFTAADAVEVDEALRAVEMDTDGLCGATVDVLNNSPAPRCSTVTTTFLDDFESGLGAWTASNTGPFGPPTPYDWIQLSGGLPGNRPGTVWFCDDPFFGDCGAQDESAVHTLFSPPIILPATLVAPTVAFTHFLGTETNFDGGNVSISVNGGLWQLIPSGHFPYNRYNLRLEFSPVNTNPLAGQEAWTGVATGWGTSLINIVPYVVPGDSIRLRFDFGKDGCTGDRGWFVDDFEVYHCPGDCNGNGVPDECDVSCGGTGGPCDLLGCGQSADCNGNLRPDSCDIADSISIDGDNNGVPDDCCSRPSSPAPEMLINASGQPAASLKQRLLSFEIPDVGRRVAVRVRFVDLPGPWAVWNGRTFWVAQPQSVCETSGTGPGQTCAPGVATFLASRLDCTVPLFEDWSAFGVVHVYHAGFVPGGRYEIQAVDEGCEVNEAAFSLPLEIIQPRWGDLSGPFNLALRLWTVPNGSVDVTVDVVSDLEKFANRTTAPGKARADVEPCRLDLRVNISDVTKVLDAFRSLPFPYAPGLGNPPCPTDPCATAD